jgi:nucleoid-associated protein YgaU
MFESGSRYFTVETATLALGDGRAVAYKRRRFLPRSETLPPMAEVTVAPGDRLDLIAARALGDPEQFWQICDASRIMNPADPLEPGTVLRVAVPQFRERS